MDSETDVMAVAAAADQRAWRRRADMALAVLAPMFAPRSVRLEYADPYHAFLFIVADDGVTVDVGRIAMDEPPVCRIR